MADNTNKIQTDRIIAYLHKLSDFELTRIAQAVKKMQTARRDKRQGAIGLNFDTKENA